MSPEQRNGEKGIFNNLDEATLFKNLPPDWFHQSQKNIIQKYWHTRRHEEVKKLIEPVSGEILDIGCWDGMFTKVILDATSARKAVGIDIEERAIVWANKFWEKNGKMEFRVGNARRLEFKSETFDAVFGLEVLEVVFEPEEVLREVKRVLKPGGYAIFDVPTDNWIFRLVWFFWIHFRGSVWKGTRRQSYRNDSLLDLVNRVGFRIEKQKKFLLGMSLALKVRK